MFCEKCGAEIINDVTYCSNCGNEVKKMNSDSENQKKKLEDKAKIKKLIIVILVLSLALTSICKGVGFFLKQNGKTTYKCTYDDIEKISNEICKNINGGEAEIKEIKSFSDGDFQVYFNVYLSGKQKETRKVSFNNYKDSDMIGAIVVNMSRGEADFHEENTYNCCIAIASAIEKTFLACRYVDEYSDYSYVMQEMRKINWLGDYVILHNYTINDGPEAIIQVDNSDWEYILVMPINSVE